MIAIENACGRGHHVVAVAAAAVGGVGNGNGREDANDEMKVGRIV